MNKTQKFSGVNLQYAQALVDETGRRVIFDVSGMDSATVSVQTFSAWTTAVVTIKWSDDMNGPWSSISGLATITNSAPAIGPFAVAGYRYLSGETTAEGALLPVSLSFNAKGY